MRGMIPLTLDEIVRAMDGRPYGDLSPVTVTGVSTDSRTCRSGDLFFAIRGERFDGHQFVGQALERKAIAVVVEKRTAPVGADASGDAPGDLKRNGSRIYVSDTVAALGKLAAFHRQQRSMTVIAVTGSNGKTTTKGMIEHVLSQHFKGRGSPESYNNAIGVPLSLLEVEVDDAFVVLEIGSNAPGEVAALSKMVSPTIGVITCIGEAHLEGLRTLHGVATEKGSLLDHLRPGGIAVIHDEALRNGLLQPPAKGGNGYTTVTFGASDDADVWISEFDGDLDGIRFKINGRHDAELRLAGKHSALNAAAAFAVCRRMKLEPEQIVSALAGFKALPMRLNVWRSHRLTLIDDSYNANPCSASAALEVLRSAGGGRKVFVAGDMLELGAEASRLHQRLGCQAAEAGIDVVVAIGGQRDAVIEGARLGKGPGRGRPGSLGCGPETIGYPDTEAACHDLPNRLHGSDTVLIKGSRRLGLERLAQRLREAFA